jgi:hypothetical protein
VTDPNNKNYSNEEDFLSKMTSDNKNEISQQPLVGTSPNFKMKLL